MQDSLKYLCAQFGYDWTTNKEMAIGVGGEWGVVRSNGHPPPRPNLFNLQKAQPLQG